MKRLRRATGWGIFPLAGWLFTDLLLAMMMIFLVASANGVPRKVTPPPVICGIDPKYQEVVVSVNDPYGVRSQTTDAMNSFFANVRNNRDLRRNTGRVAGVVEVFGGSSDVNDGVNFAAGAIQSLRRHSDGRFIFTSRTVYFKPLWDGGLNASQVRIYVFYFIVAPSCST